MTVEEFLETHNYAPYTFEETAGIVSKITDDIDLAHVAKVFLEAQDDLSMALFNIGFEFG